MIGRIVEIAEEGRHAAVSRGFLTVAGGGATLGRVALDDLAAVIFNAHGITVSNSLMVRLAERRIPLVLCGANHLPAALVWPVAGHHAQSGRIADQAAASKPLKKRLWTQIVQAKIRQQGATLAQCGAPYGGFALLARKVKSGDPENVEAEAARRYWPLLFGRGFRRDRQAGGLNGLLNYGYTVLRAGVARAVIASGLTPSLGLMHSSRVNAHVLVDDLMEPFRPTVDREVWRLVREGMEEVTGEAKAELARLMIVDLPTKEGMSPMMTAAERLAQSLARAFAGEEARLALPLDRLPLTG
ncbi:MAG: type II CRISPR-associated endonuclease Cas1 [Rhodospirillales bacterium]|nr:type II CRISPR-associated endonuclease Cas1 [Rhodospirillales bacterium]